MKRLLISILFSLILAASALTQNLYIQNKKESRNKTIYSLAVVISQIAFEAAGDALLDRGKESGNQDMMAWGHGLQAASIVPLMTTPLFLDRGDILPFMGSIFLSVILTALSRYSQALLLNRTEILLFFS